MARVNGVTEHRRRQTDQEGLFRNLTNKLGSRLVVRTQEQFQVALVRVKLVNSFEVCEELSKTDEGNTRC